MKPPRIRGENKTNIWSCHHPVVFCCPKDHWTLETSYFEDLTPAIQVQTLPLEGPRSLGCVNFQTTKVPSPTQSLHASRCILSSISWRGLLESIWSGDLPNTLAIQHSKKQHIMGVCRFDVYFSANHVFFKQILRQLLCDLWILCFFANRLFISFRCIWSADTVTKSLPNLQTNYIPKNSCPSDPSPNTKQKHHLCKQITITDPP